MASKQYSKVRSVVSNTDVLLEQLSTNQKNLEDVEDSKALKIYSLNIQTASYIWCNILFEILLSSEYLPSNSTFKELVAVLREYSANDEYGLKLISQFEETYQSEKAIDWLRSDTPLARFFNKALREQDINMLFMLRFFLVDIHKQLSEHQTESLNAFRLQPMTRSHMDFMLANPGQILIFNGFLFASTDKPKLISNIKQNDQFEIVLFDIKAKYQQGVAPFAFIRDLHSNISKGIEQEVLFMCNSIFQVSSFKLKDSIWTLELTLVNEFDVHVLFQIKQQLKQTHNLCIIGDLLNRCEKSTKAMIYYHRLLTELPEKHALKPKIYEELSKIASEGNAITSLDTQYVLVNLIPYMNDFTSNILGTLCSLTSGLIHILNDESNLDFSECPNRSVLLFTTAQFAVQLKNLPNYVKLYTLEDKQSTGNDSSKFATMEDLLGKLSDEIILKHRLDAKQYSSTNQFERANEHEETANRIYHELKNLYHQNFMKDNTLNNRPNKMEPSLIWLISRNENMQNIEGFFGNYFSNYKEFHNEHTCHGYIAKNEHEEDIFLIIGNNYKQIAENSFRQFSNVKHIYYYGKPKNNDEKGYCSQDDLRYHLTYDLIGYFRQLGDNYEKLNQPKLARDIFLKAQKLCKFLSEKFFSFD